MLEHPKDLILLKPVEILRIIKPVRFGYLRPEKRNLGQVFMPTSGEGVLYPLTHLAVLRS